MLYKSNYNNLKHFKFYSLETKHLALKYKHCNIFSLMPHDCFIFLSLQELKENDFKTHLASKYCTNSAIHSLLKTRWVYHCAIICTYHINNLCLLLHWYYSPSESGAGSRVESSPQIWWVFGCKGPAAECKRMTQWD